MQGEILPILVAKVRCYSEEHQVLAGEALHDLIEQKVSSVQIRIGECSGEPDEIILAEDDRGLGEVFLNQFLAS